MLTDVSEKLTASTTLMMEAVGGIMLIDISEKLSKFELLDRIFAPNKDTILLG
jgi:hypothetical protein